MDDVQRSGTPRAPTFWLSLCLLLLPAPGHPAVPASDAHALEDRLTPVGAERSRNAAGTIPAWDGGYQGRPAGFVAGKRYPDPYANDAPLFVIDSSNAAKYAAQLSPGQQALLNRYPGWKMPVYPTRRSAAFPAAIYDQTRANATTVRLVDGGNGFTGTTGGVPFPIPQSGLEVIWNHLTAYRGDTFRTAFAQAAVTANGDYNLVRLNIEFDAGYNNQRLAADARPANLLFHFLQDITDPPRLSGTSLLVHDYVDQVSAPRKAWTYNPGQRRVRLSPNVAHDNPAAGADGLRTSDDFSLFNGATDRYDWKLLGKQELYIPYNAYRLNAPDLSIADVLRPGHINARHARYELHRVWVVEATLRTGATHLYKKRVFYIDEDSWVIHVVDKYDNRDQLWRVAELHSFGVYDVPFLATGLQVHHDLQSGRYLALGLRNDADSVYIPIQRTAADFTPQALRERGKR